ncbi:MAG: Ig-like domain-containing protein [Bacteroidales bacterium]|nr:Ig-like domain-containing protein [Bacteroidales bacterium]
MLGYFKVDRIARLRICKLLTIIMLAAYCLHSSSCANTRGAPTGGPKDTIPPVVLNMEPDSNAINFPVVKGKITITFDEYVQLKDPSKNIILSPPQKKRPKTSIKGKSIVVTFEEPLDSNTTYSLNFGNAIVDNNESNPLPFFTYTFSTGTTIDTMMLSGNVYDYATLLPVEGATVSLYHNAKDSSVFNDLPAAVTKTDKWGYFVVRNIKNVPYRVYTIKDENNNNKYDPGLELVGFLDSLYTPNVIMEKGMPQLGIYDMKDTLACMSRPSEIELVMFPEKTTKQYIRDYKRVSERGSYIKFGAPNVQIDSFSIKGIKSSRVLQQLNATKDSLCFWIKDGSMIDDTLFVGIKYLKSDSLNNLVPTAENLKFILPKALRNKDKSNDRSKQDNKEKKRKDLLELSLKATPETLDQDGFVLEFPEPLLVAKQDSLRFTMIDPKQQKFNAPYTFTRDTADLKRYILMPVDEFKKGNEYELFIPQFAFKDIYGNTNDSTKLKVSLPNDEKLSSIAMQLTNVDTKYIIELVNDTRDKIFRRYTVTKDSTLLFPYLKEGDYSIRITQDLNANGRLDIGDVLAGKLPEKVRLYRLPGGEAIIKVGERMDIEQSVDLKELFNN